ncbi:phosphatase PAP2 family protein [Yinghuangia sp. YIM S10712]|uniref:phosphatase PAP2 family protein n=1 Tax=Yinghuangia sp. YIM S10712 TaxID=3436930 RepID=UPI003F539A15
MRSRGHEAIEREVPLPERRFDRQRAFVAGAVLLAAFTLLAVPVELSWSPLEELDAGVARHLDAWVTADAVRVDTASVLSDWVWDPFVFRGLVLVVCVWLWRQGERRTVMWAVVAMAAAAGTSGLMKIAFDRPRPEGMAVTAPGGSFPSGHVVTATVGAGVLVLLLAPALSARLGLLVRGIALVSVVGVGATRAVLGAHYLTDVVGGWLLGGAILALTCAAFASGRRQELGGKARSPAVRE